MDLATFLALAAAAGAPTVSDPLLVGVVAVITTVYGLTLGGLFMAGKIHTDGELTGERVDKLAWKDRAEKAEAAMATFYRETGERHLAALLQTADVMRASTAVSERVVDALTHRGRP